MLAMKQYNIIGKHLKKETVDQISVKKLYKLPMV